MLFLSQGTHGHGKWISRAVMVWITFFKSSFFFKCISFFLKEHEEAFHSENDWSRRAFYGRTGVESLNNKLLISLSLTPHMHLCTHTHTPNSFRRFQMFQPCIWVKGLIKGCEKQRILNYFHCLNTNFLLVKPRLLFIGCRVTFRPNHKNMCSCWKNYRCCSPTPEI